jgi:pilus assembly protein CpaB
MNSRVSIFAFVLTAIGFLLVQTYVENIETEAQKKYGSKTQVVKANIDIKEQETITEKMITFDSVPRQFVEPAAVIFEGEAGSETEQKKLKQLIGTIAVVPIRKGEQITYNKVTEPSVRTGLSPQIAPGRRAISIPATDATAVSRLLKPGDRVDVIAIIDGGGGKDNKIAKTIIQDVMVLATGKNVSGNVARLVERDASGRERVRSLNEDTSYTSVTLEVDPATAQNLAVLSIDHTLVLSLRNNDDSDRSGVAASNLADILGTDASRIQRRVAGGK